MIFGPIGSLPIGTIPLEVVGAPVPSVPYAPPAGGGLRYDDIFIPKPRKRAHELTEAELTAILLAADEQYWN